MEISTRSQRGFGTSEGREVVSAVIVEIFHAPFAGPITILVDRHLSVERIDCGVDKPLAALTSRHAPPPTRTATISSNVLGGSATGIITTRCADAQIVLSNCRRGAGDRDGGERRSRPSASSRTTRRRSRRCAATSQPRYARWCEPRLAMVNVTTSCWRRIGNHVTAATMVGLLLRHFQSQSAARAQSLTADPSVARRPALSCATADVP
jgi:hypothetical protein